MPKLVPINCKTSELGDKFLSATEKFMENYDGIAAYALIAVDKNGAISFSRAGKDVFLLAGLEHVKFDVQMAMHEP
jgi:hypothetical protein